MTTESAPAGDPRPAGPAPRWYRTGAGWLLAAGVAAALVAALAVVVLRGVGTSSRPVSTPGRLVSAGTGIGYARLGDSWRPLRVGVAAIAHPVGQQLPVGTGARSVVAVGEADYRRVPYGGRLGVKDATAEVVQTVLHHDLGNAPVDRVLQNQSVLQDDHPGWWTSVHATVGDPAVRGYTLIAGVFDTANGRRAAVFVTWYPDTRPDLAAGFRHTVASIRFGG